MPKVKIKISIKNGLRDKAGAIMGDTDKEKKRVRINLSHKAHKKDPSELASTIKHEMFHAKYPNMTEKEVYKKTCKTKIPEPEQKKLISMLKKKKGRTNQFSAKRFNNARRKVFKLPNNY